ncbi:hypothetical protein VP1G_05280 [Cytospora mali]|uniref:Uncharacterized protein n=1 Tax=Cytospora mali TaxID=578113 RepID=A0A194V2B5_CYTMA|nr:hypothetical protein VP1G_05280 [Valsa mali var. pyri (nom. inval.)]
MPRQLVIFGRPVPRLSSRRVSVLLASLAIFAVFSLLFTAPSSMPGPTLSMSDHKFSMSIPKWKSLPSWNPFKTPAHAPVRQANDTDGESSWFSDWRWLAIPFSSSYTLDENRALLPVMPRRTEIYCYYDTTIQREEAVKKAESDILLSWRRAWWAQGFKPIILSDAEATNNPLYEELQRMVDIDPGLKTDMMRLLAWENMGGGLLSHYLLFPMGAHDDPLLTYLRRGEYQGLTRWEGLGDGLFAGSKPDITAAIKSALGSSKVKLAQDFLSALPEDKDDEKKTFWVDKPPKSLAYYDVNTLQTKYDKVAKAVTDNRATGLRALNQLITSHLHLTWQNNFNKGIAVLKPLPHHTTTMVQPAVELANRLQKCHESPMQSSCPPNNAKCVACVSATPLKLSSPSRYRNTTGLYTIGTVPHPYTLHILNELRDNIDIPWVRRNCPRDAWLAEVTKEYLGTGVGGAPRVLRFKEAVAAEFAASKSIWLPAEQSLPDDMDWHFGFEIPTEGLDLGKSETPVPGPERRPQPVHDPADGPVANPQDLEREPALLKRAKNVVAVPSKDKNDVAVRNAIEAWNLADTEAWKFARAFLARERVERVKFEEEESKYAQGVGTEKDRRDEASWGALVGYGA